ncbi:hypothetical protein HR12_24940 [Microbacterium sp. SUBG005]|nr:hypothetical protein HR12_24940 [Microbacterium sp. SUBG005]
MVMAVLRPRRRHSDGPSTAIFVATGPARQPPPEVDGQLVSSAHAMHAFTLPDADAPEHGAQSRRRPHRRS